MVSVAPINNIPWRHLTEGSVAIHGIWNFWVLSDPKQTDDHGECNRQKPQSNAWKNLRASEANWITQVSIKMFFLGSAWGAIMPTGSLRFPQGNQSPVAPSSCSCLSRSGFYVKADPDIPRWESHGVVHLQYQHLPQLSVSSFSVT